MQCSRCYGPIIYTLYNCTKFLYISIFKKNQRSLKEIKYFAPQLKVTQLKCLLCSWNSNPGLSAPRWCSFQEASLSLSLSLVYNNQQTLGNDLFAHLFAWLACESFKDKARAFKMLDAQHVAQGWMNVCLWVEAQGNILPITSNTPVCTP